MYRGQELKVYSFMKFKGLKGLGFKASYGFRAYRFMDKGFIGV